MPKKIIIISMKLPRVVSLALFVRNDIHCISLKKYMK